MSSSERDLLVRMRVMIPFLREIPDSIYFALDTSEFFLPTQLVAKVRAELEGTLNQNIMTYKSDVLNLAVPVGRHLCGNLKPTQLTLMELALLQTKEEVFREAGINISFSAYQKPVELINPRDSAIYTYYKEKGLA